MAEFTSPSGLVVKAAESPIALLKRAAAQAPEHPALIMGDTVLTYAAFDAAVDQMAQRLVDSGAKGRVVAILLPNSIEMCILCFAVQRAGGISSTLNPDYTERELAPILADADPAVIIMQAGDARSLPDGLARMTIEDDVVGALSAYGRLDAPLPHPDNIASLQYTGGTTGRSKGVMLTHRAIAENIAQREAFLPTARCAERVLCIMPLFHVFAVAMCLHLAVRAQSTLVLLPRYRPDWLLEAISQHKITLLPAGPTVFQSLLNFDGLLESDLSSVTAAFSGSAPLSAQTLAKWEKDTGIPIYEGYGQTEAGPVLTYHSPHFTSKIGSVGPALPGTDLEIVDVDAGETILARNKPGEIRARGPQIMTGYRNLPQETAETLRNGWLYTGDIGRLDEDGFLFIEDRKKDLVISGGYNIYPREIDEVLCAHEHVFEAAAIGVPDSYRGEVIEAYVVLKLGGSLSDVEAFAAKNLVKYKRPARFIPLETLPKTSVGKIDKKALRMISPKEAKHVSH